MGFTVFRSDEVEWEERTDGSGRRVARLSDAMSSARANLWRYPPGARGRRHVDHAQEETFVVIAGSPSMFLGDPAERVDLSPGAVVVVQSGTALQIANDGADEAMLFIVGAPPERGEIDFLPDAE